MNKLLAFGLLIGSALILTRCADSPPPGVSKQVENRLLGTWRLRRIRCDSQPVPSLPDTLFADVNSGVSMKTIYNGGVGERTWTIGSCSQLVPLDVTYYEDHISVVEKPPVCSGNCVGYEAQCSTPEQKTENPFILTDTEVVFIVQKTPQAADPCGKDWSQKVEFVLEKQ